MSQTATLSELDILADAITPDEGDLSPSVARSFLQWKFSDHAVTRMNKLARKNNAGTLTAREQQELDSLMRVGSLIV